MENVIESLPKSIMDSPMKSTLTFIGKTGALEIKHFDLAIHHDRVAMQKIITWNMRNGTMEFRVRRTS